MGRIRSDNLLPQSYNAGTLARLLRTYDTEFNRLTAYQGTFTWDPANIANGSSDSTTATVPGVKVNSMSCVRVFPPYPLQGLVAGGEISADDTVKVTLVNNTGGAVNLASGTWGVIVESMPIVV